MNRQATADTATFLRTRNDNTFETADDYGRVVDAAKNATRSIKDNERKERF